MEVFDIVVKILSAVGGLIGTILGIYNYIHARRKDYRELSDKESAKQEESADWELFAEINKASKEGFIFKPDDGSEEQKRAERLVAKGMLQRLPGASGYGVPGQMYRVGK